MSISHGFTGTLFIISGPSGSGKTTLRDGLLRSHYFKRRLAKSISCTTRPRRSGERHGRDYFFISPEEFQRRQRQKKNLEWTKYLGYYYTTPREFVEDKLQQGRNLVLCLDVRGAMALKRLYPRNTVTIFILPPSLSALKARITTRCQRIRPQEVTRRLALARKELAACQRYEHCLVNKDLARTHAKLAALIKSHLSCGMR